MAGSARTPTLTALLCLGERSGKEEGWGTLPKPSIWADPGHIVTQGRPVTIWCQASLRADGYYLYKERVSEPFWETSPDSSNKAGFPFASMSSHTAGRYQCAYHSRNSWSQRSDFLPLVVTGAYGAPSLSANPGPVVALGGTVSLSCSSQEAWQSFHLLKEGGADAPQQLELTSHPETSPPSRQKGMECGLRGTPRSRSTVHGVPGVMAPVTQLPPSPSGAYGAPSLSANPGPVVALGGTVSLSCSSQEAWQSFRLLKEGGADAPQQLEFTSHPETYHALFLVGPVNTSHAGTYRCYASPQSYPHSWSQPSDPLHLQVTGEGAPSPSPPTSWAQMTDLSHIQDYTVENLIRLGMSALILVVLGVLLFQARHREDPKIQAGHRRKRQKTDFSVR
uniref:Immunoglobulin domain-containing protein n=1 Tax=Ursus maritimus TaxID=29073 RepID=A0A452VKS7_URSMA